MDDRLACAGNATGAVNQRMIGQTVGGVADQCIDARRGGWVPGTDVVENIEQVRRCLVGPPER